MSRRRILSILFVFVVTMSLLSALYVRQSFLFPAPEQGVPVSCRADAPTLPVGRPLKVLVWNVQFAGSRSFSFFYDYGEQVSVPIATVHETLEGLAAAIEASEADLVLLQEVDRGARRTGYVDQHAWLAERLDYACDLSTPYWRAPYVPNPSHEHLGRVELHLSVFSRYRVDEATRVALPLLREPVLRRQFNLKRAVLEVTLPTADGRQMVVANTHISAFSNGDGTKAMQLALIDQRLEALERAKTPWLIAGDFNSLPPGDDASRLPELDRQWYAESTSAILPLLDKYVDPVGDGWQADPEAWHTFLRGQDEAPDRTLDYVLHGRQVTGSDHRVLSEHNDLSDHLPLLFTFSL